MMNDSPIFRARQAAIARAAKLQAKTNVQENVEKPVQEEAKKAKKKPEPEVKVLGGRPIVPDPQNTIKRAEYCNNGVVYSYSVALGKTLDVSYGRACRLDPSKTVTLAGL